MKDKLSASEALFGFCGWLTSKNKIVQMGNIENCELIASLIVAWCKANNLPGPQKGWEKKLTWPVCNECIKRLECLIEGYKVDCNCQGFEKINE